MTPLASELYEALCIIVPGKLRPTMPPGFTINDYYDVFDALAHPVATDMLEREMQLAKLRLLTEGYIVDTFRTDQSSAQAAYEYAVAYGLTPHKSHKRRLK